MIKRILTILLLVMALAVVQPRQAHACIFPVSILCNIFQGETIAKTVNSAVENFLTSFSAAFRAQIELRMNIAQDKTRQALTAQGLMAEQVARTQPSANCPGAASTSRTMIAANGGSVRGAGAPRPNPAAAQRGTSGCVSTRCQITEPQGSIGSTKEALASAKEAMQEEEKKRLTDQASAPVKMLNDMKFRAIYRNCGTEGNVDENGNATNQCVFGLYPDADLSPQIIFGQPTFIEAPYSYQIPVKDKDGNAKPPITKMQNMDANARLNAGFNYCIMAIMPEGAGELVKTDQDNIETLRQRFRERAQNSRLSLAFDVCTDSVARRVAANIDVSGPGYGWLKGTLCDLRIDRLTRDVRITNAGILNGVANSLNSFLGLDCGADSKALAQVSDYDLFKTISADLYGNPGFASSLGGNTNELLKVMTSLKVVEAQMNQRLYDMQEKAGLLDAAMLAVDVESKRGD